MDSNTKIQILTFNVAGVSHRPASLIDPLNSGEKIRLVPEPANPYDPYAIKVECQFIYEDERGTVWEHIGYVPKKSTWLPHLIRKLGVPIELTLSVNHDARPEDMLLVSMSSYGNENAPFVGPDQNARS